MATNEKKAPVFATSYLTSVRKAADAVTLKGGEKRHAQLILGERLHARPRSADVKEVLDAAGIDGLAPALASKFEMIHRCYVNRGIIDAKALAFAEGSGIDKLYHHGKGKERGSIVSKARAEKVIRDLASLPLKPDAGKSEPKFANLQVTHETAARFAAAMGDDADKAINDLLDLAESLSADKAA